MNGHVVRRESKNKARWQAMVYVDKAHGGPRWKSAGTFTLKREAEAALTKTLDAYLAGTYREASTLTVDVMVDNWLTQHVAQLRLLSIRNYTQICEHFILPAFGGRIAEDVTPTEVAAWLAWMLREGRRDGLGGMAPKYVRQVRFVLRAAYAWNVKLGEIARNPVDAAPGPPVPRREFDPPTVKRMQAAMAALKGTRYHVPMALAAATGMRRGEVLGLSWRHVDMASAVVHVRRQLIDMPEGVALATLKTEAALRDLHLPPFLVATLKAEMERQQANAQIAGQAWSVDAFVCPNYDGGPIPPDGFSRGFTGVLKRRGLPLFHFHDLRHALATEMLESGERADVVSRLLGHASVGITLGVYAHVRPGVTEEAAARYGQRFEPPEPSADVPAGEPDERASRDSRMQPASKSAPVLDLGEARRQRRPA